MTSEEKGTRLSRDKFKIAAIIPAFNEENKICRVIRKIPRKLVDEIVVIDDGSTDLTARQASEENITLLTHAQRKGIGSAIRTGLDYGLRNDFDIFVIMAGNDKDDPSQIDRLLHPIINGGCDYVQGSRYLPGGEYGQMPLHRKLFTRLYSCAVKIMTGFNLTDGTNGFRAYGSWILKDRRIILNQEWLDEALEYYLSIKVIMLNYKIKEVPVTKLYPQVKSYKAYTKVKPFSGWWKRIKPLLYLKLRIKQ